MQPSGIWIEIPTKQYLWYMSWLSTLTLIASYPETEFSDYQCVILKFELSESEQLWTKMLEIHISLLLGPFICVEYTVQHFLADMIPNPEQLELESLLKFTSRWWENDRKLPGHEVSTIDQALFGVLNLVLT